MNIDEAKTIPISDVAERLGAKLHKRIKPHVTVWFSPFRNEKTASFHIDERENAFKDFGHHLPKGDVIDLWVDFHGLKRNDRDATQEALKALEAFDTIPRITIYKEAKAVTYSDVYKILSFSNYIKDKALKKEIDRRRVPKWLVEDYAQEAVVEFKGHKFRYFAIKNDNDGHNISRFDEREGRSFKNCVGPQGPTTYHAHPSAERITSRVFWGWTDHIAFLAMNGNYKPPNEEHIVLNGDGNVGSAGQSIVTRKDKIDLVIGYPHHDESGGGQAASNALALILEENDMRYGTQDDIFDGFKDLSDFRMNNKLEQQNNYRSNSPKTTLRPRY